MKTSSNRTRRSRKPSVLAFEACFDGLVGPTHNYSGLSFGNVASTSNRALRSNPLGAVLQGLEKMRSLSELGVVQAVLPPQERPYFPFLRKLGYVGNDKQILEKVGKDSPELLSAVSSASSMWTANAATISPSADTADGRIHFTPANLVSKLHRSIETSLTAEILKKIFSNPDHFVHHPPLPSDLHFGDEGAANHTRLCTQYAERGIEFFVFGRRGFKADLLQPKRFPARQTLEASKAVTRLHLLRESEVIFAQQSPEAIDTGVFHNDVAGVGNQNVYFYHEQAYVDSKQVINELKSKFRKTCGKDLITLEVPTSEVTLKDAVESYLFNSQLITTSDGTMAFVLPSECQENPRVARYVMSLLSQSKHSIRQALYFDLKQSMRNGGGPACLRLRIVLNEAEMAAANDKVFLSQFLYERLVRWAKEHYRDQLLPKDLTDPKLLIESCEALDELTQILGLGSIYSFQS